MNNISNSKYGNEEIFAVPYQNTLDIQDGFTHQKHDKKIWSKYDNLGKYIPRDIVEGHNEFQQIIPYILIKSLNNRYLIAKRTNSDDIYNTISIGFGGHLNPCDGMKQILFQGAVRELLQQVNLSNLLPMKFVGYVRDMKGKISDHLGIVFLIDMIEESETNIRETNNLIGDWYSVDDLVEHYGKLESWSKHITNFLVENSL